MPFLNILIVPLGDNRWLPPSRRQPLPLSLSGKSLVSRSSDSFYWAIKEESWLLSHPFRHTYHNSVIPFSALIAPYVLPWWLFLSQSSFYSNFFSRQHNVLERHLPSLVLNNEFLCVTTRRIHLSSQTRSSSSFAVDLESSILNLQSNTHSFRDQSRKCIASLWLYISNNIYVLSTPNRRYQTQEGMDWFLLYKVLWMYAWFCMPTKWAASKFLLLCISITQIVTQDSGLTSEITAYKLILTSWKKG